MDFFLRDVIELTFDVSGSLPWYDLWYDVFGFL
jgi:hypothetical protein